MRLSVAAVAAAVGAALVSAQEAARFGLVNVSPAGPLTANEVSYLSLSILHLHAHIL